MTEIVVPRTVPSMGAAPDPNSPPAVFDAACVALANKYADFVPGMNNAASDTYQNAVAVREFAVAMQTLWGQVSAGVITIQQALAAIQAGPVVSVMGRSGVVTGLVEQSIALPANTDLNTVVSSGFYRLYPTPVNAPADVGVSYGQMVVSRGSDTIVQMVFDHDKGGMALRVGYNTGLAAPVFSRWQRVLSDGNVLEKAHIQFVSGAATVNPVNGSIADIVFGANTTITVAAPRAPGDQVLLRLQPLGSYSYSFAGTNVRHPSGASLPTIAAYIQLSISLVANRDGSTWDAYIGPKH